ncbi:hypothetical protein C1645_828717, partial [Glomus cerebriforme]
MGTINIELWKSPNPPSLDILESRTKTVLKAFNKCRKLDIELQGNDNEIKKFSQIFDSLTERRAKESHKHSMYSDNVVIYIQLLSEESTSVGVILDTLSYLLGEATTRQENTMKLKNDYQKFLENFNNNIVSNGSNNSQIFIRDQRDQNKIAIDILTFTISILFSCGASIFYLNMSPILPYYTKNNEKVPEWHFNDNNTVQIDAQSQPESNKPSTDSSTQATP